MYAMRDISNSSNLTPAFSASDVGLLIRSERRARGLTQQELANKIRCSRQTIIEIESGGNVSLYTLMSILSGLGKGLEIVDARIDVDRLAEIFGDDDDDPKTIRAHSPR